MTTWHYVKSGAIRDEQIGPIDTETLARRIEAGEITPETMICSPEKTGSQWVQMRVFDKLVIIFERGRDARADAKRAAKEAKAQEKALARRAKQEQTLARRERAAEAMAARQIQPRVPRPAPQLLPAEQPAAPMFVAAAPAPQVHQSTTVNVRVGRPFNHLLHFVLSVVTCGAWLPIWILCRLFYRG